MHKLLHVTSTRIDKEWSEIFDDLHINSVPVNYLKVVHIEFQDGSKWEINVFDQCLNNDSYIVTYWLNNVLQEFNEKIKKIDFDLNFDIEKFSIKLI